MAVREEMALENEVSYYGSLGRASLIQPIQPLNAPRSVSLRKQLASQSCSIKKTALSFDNKKNIRVASGERSHTYHKKKLLLSLSYHMSIAAYFLAFHVVYIFISYHHAFFYIFTTNTNLYILLACSAKYPGSAARRAGYCYHCCT